MMVPCVPLVYHVGSNPISATLLAVVVEFEVFSIIGR